MARPNYENAAVTFHNMPYDHTDFQVDDENVYDQCTSQAAPTERSQRGNCYSSNPRHHQTLQQQQSLSNKEQQESWDVPEVKPNSCSGLVLWKIITGVALILAVVAMFLAVFATVSKNSLPDLTDSQTGSKKVHSSCMSIRRSGQNTTGVYTIATDGVEAIKVYCDMESGGGGWTLVASVHENNIHAKCSAGDKWSSESPVTSTQFSGSNNWENTNVFGELEAVTGADYKNSGYFTINASDIMIWHVPNDVDVASIDQQAFLKYYTSNHFLNTYGNSLQTLYKDFLPLHPGYNNRGAVASDLLKRITRLQTRITSLVPLWYSYEYDAGKTNNYISNGSDTDRMYIRGNYVSYSINAGNYVDLYYGRTYANLQQDYLMTSAAIQPFTALAWIGNTFKTISTFSIKVFSNYHSDWSGPFGIRTYTFENVMISGDFTIKYRSRVGTERHFRGRSICEVYFVISSEKVWDSNDALMTSRTSSWNSTISINEIEFSNLHRVVVGYTLLSSRYYYHYVSRSEVEKVLKVFLTQAREIKVWKPASNLVVPVEFSKGTPADIFSRLPQAYQPDITPGFIHFRPLNSLGESFAICPGTRVRSDMAAYVTCIGGRTLESRYCGDYSRWEGQPKYSTNGLPTKTGRSESDIRSTILIFTRNIDDF